MEEIFTRDNEKNERKRKKRFWIFFTFFATITIAAITVTAIVLATRQSNVRSDINVGYKSKEVAAWVSAGFHYGETGEFTAFTGGDNGVVKFDGGEENAVGVLNCPEEVINLENEVNKNSVVFKYHFINKGSSPINAVLSLPAGENIAIEYSLDGVNWSKTNTAVHIDGGVDNTADYYVRFSIVHVGIDAFLTGKFEWILQNALI